MQPAKSTQWDLNSYDFVSSNNTVIWNLVSEYETSHTYKVYGNQTKPIAFFNGKWKISLPQIASYPS